MIYSFEGKTPVIAESAFVAPEATIIGDVVIGEDAAIFPGVVIRGDVGGIRIGARTNVQDNSVIHVQTGTTTVLGDDVTVGHMAMVHGEEVGNGTMVGMGATVLAYSKIGSGCIIGGGAVVLEGQKFPTARSPREFQRKCAASFPTTKSPGWSITPPCTRT